MKTPKHKKQTIRITKSDFRNAGGYIDNQKCLLATAMRRLGFGVADVTPGRIGTSIGVFRYSDTGDYRIRKSYPQQKNGQCFCNRRPRPEAKPFSLVIIPGHPIF